LRVSASVRALVAERVHFRAGPYLLEGQLAYPEEGLPRGGVVIAGSHPLLGGNMDNNVVRALADGLAEQGLVSVRFNYRGVGASQGPAVDVAAHMAQFWRTSHVPGEADYAQDLQGAVNFLHSATGPGLPLALVGYSFGCSLYADRKVRDAAAALVLVAPTPQRHDYTPLRSAEVPMLVVASEDDFATDTASLRHWFESLSGPRRLVLGPFDNHFFRGHEEWLAQTVFDFLAQWWR
jgi:alpha/beta superfamily hydrolase